MAKNLLKPQSLVLQKFKVHIWYMEVCVAHPTMPDTHSWAENSTHTVPVTTGVYTTLLEWGRGWGSEKVGGDRRGWAEGVGGVLPN